MADLDAPLLGKNELKATSSTSKSRVNTEDEQKQTFAVQYDEIERDPNFYKRITSNDEKEHVNETLTLEQLILWITSSQHGQHSDNNEPSLDILILTHTLFTDSASLIKAFKQRFLSPIPDNILNIQDTGTRETRIREYQDDAQKRTHLRLIKALRDWQNQTFRQDFYKNDTVKCELEALFNALASYGQMGINKHLAYIGSL
eukprot:839487_1